MSKEVKYYRKKGKDVVQCKICPHKCIISPGNRGICRVRVNENGVLKAVNYGLCTAIALDPIEKKPLKDFCSGSVILSIGTFGCNLKCSFCQNWQIAHAENPRTDKIQPEEVAHLAKIYESEGNIGIAYTYSEPLMWYEFVFDTAKEVKDLGQKNVLVTNGYIEEEPLLELLPYIDAANVDIKAFNEKFYPELCQGSLDPVKRSVEIIAENSHLEITTLVIPGKNDNLTEIEQLAQWLGDISPSIPLHLSRYFPNYRLELPPTPLQTLKQAQEIATKYLDKVYLGNV